MTSEFIDPIIVGLTILGLFIAFIKEWVKPDIAVVVAVSILMILGLLDSKQVLSVFSNSAPITVATLFIISAALEKTGCVAKLSGWIASVAGENEKKLLAMIMLTALAVSPFINNTPVVMVLMPAVIAVAVKIQ